MTIVTIQTVVTNRPRSSGSFSHFPRVCHTALQNDTTTERKQSDDHHSNTCCSISHNSLFHFYHRETPFSGEMCVVSSPGKPSFSARLGKISFSARWRNKIGRIWDLLTFNVFFREILYNIDSLSISISFTQKLCWFNKKLLLRTNSTNGRLHDNINSNPEINTLPTPTASMIVIEL